MHNESHQSAERHSSNQTAQQTQHPKKNRGASPRKWVVGCAEALFRVAQIRVPDLARRQVCASALATHVTRHITAERIGNYLAGAFKATAVGASPEKPTRARAATPKRLFRRRHLAQIIQEQTGCLIGKPAILLALGAELESAILAELSPAKVRRIICEALDQFVSPPRKERSPAKVAAVPHLPPRKAPEATTVTRPQNPAPPV